MKALKKGLPAVIVISLIQGGGQLMLSQVNQTLCCFVPCCIALVACILLGRTKLYKEDGGAYFNEENGEVVHLPNDTVVSMNFWAFTPKVFKGLEADFAEFINDDSREPLKSECLLPNTIGKMINACDCDVKVLTTSAKWFGVTYANDKPDVIANLKALINTGEYPNGLWK